MKRLFLAYQVLALIVGVLLLVGSAGAILKYGHHLVGAEALVEGGDLQQLGETLSVVWQPHGLIYMVYLVVAFVLTQKANWSLGQFLMMLIAGLIPGLIFWVERRVALRLREDNPELAA